MPKLSHPTITKGQAIAYLLRFYRNDATFMKELKQLRQPYLEALNIYGKAWLAFGASCAKILQPCEFQAFVTDYLQGKELPPVIADYLSLLQQKGDILGPYADKLAGLASKWKLRAPWAVHMLFLLDVVDILLKFGIPEEINIPLEFLEFLYPFPPPSPALELKIPSYAFIFYDKQEIITQISLKLHQYQAILKTKGLRERPSRLEKYALWWFEHYIQGKKYDEIAQMECYSPNGSLISYAKNVGTAVRKFSRLIGIEPRQSNK